MPVTTGSRLGPYEIVAPIGAGGMGEVYKARDTRLDRSVAIKILPPEFADDAQLKLRFEREAKTISQLNHPQHLHALRRRQRDGVEYLVMELLEGETLADRLARGPLPLERGAALRQRDRRGARRAHRAGDRPSRSEAGQRDDHEVGREAARLRTGQGRLAVEISPRRRPRSRSR